MQNAVRVPNILLDARLSIRGLGIATFIERLYPELCRDETIAVHLWRGRGGWTPRGKLSTLSRSGLFDVSPKLDPRTHKFDAVHFACNFGSLFPGRNSVLTVHDLLYRRNRRSRDRALGSLLERCLPRVAHVVAVSTQTRQELERSFPGLSGKVEVIPHGLRRLPYPRGDRRHVLSLGGGNDPRKRVDLMIAVYRRYRETTPHALPLVVLARAGLSAHQGEELRSLGAELVTDAEPGDVDALMAGAAALLYTTVAEGFGLPIVEAGEVGTPVVMDGRASVAPEVKGRHCLLVSGEGVDAWVAELRRAIEMGPVADPLDLPYWPSVADRYLNLYRRSGA